MLKMSPRERILTAINHKEPDRIPIDFGSSHVSTIHVKPYEELKKYYNIESENKIAHKMLQVVIPDERLMELFGSDTRGIFLEPPDNWNDVDLGNGCYKDQWGIFRKMPEDGYYYDQIEPFPLGKTDLSYKDIDNYNWPDPHDSGRYRYLREKALEHKRKGDYALVLNFGASFVHRAQYLRSTVKWYEDLILQPDLAGYLMDRILDYFIELGKHVFEEVGDLIDIVAIGDDLGTQRSLQISPKLFREILKPRYKRLIDFIKEESNAYINFHSCGSIVLIINDLIEIGVNIINPVQTSAMGMESKRLKSEFGDKITFCGAIDTQDVLPNGSKEDVKKEVKDKIRDLGSDGGYILAATNNIQPDVPIENIITLFSAAKAFGKYPLID